MILPYVCKCYIIPIYVFEREVAAVSLSSVGANSIKFDGNAKPNVTFLGHQVRGISGSTIKIIAIMSMLVDHTAEVLIYPIISNIAALQQQSVGDNGYPEIFNSGLYTTYVYMRSFGRLGFPIFCFLLIEGFLHTKSKGKYIFRLGIFSFLSEIPFDLALNGFVIGSGRYKLFDISYQNVFFTLFLGMCVIVSIDKILYIEKMKSKALRYMVAVPVIIAGIAAANVLRTDYGGWGVLTIVVMYFLRYYKKAEMYGGCITLTFMSLNEAYAFPAIIPIALYNGTRGAKLKYFFYLFYPGHLLLLKAIAWLMGISV